jgi:hypothetical protein
MKHVENIEWDKRTHTNPCVSWTFNRIYTLPRCMEPWTLKYIKHCDCLFRDGKCYLSSQTASHISVVSASVSSATPPGYIRITPIHTSSNIKKLVNPPFWHGKEGRKCSISGQVSTLYHPGAWFRGLMMVKMSFRETRR